MYIDIIPDPDKVLIQKKSVDHSKFESRFELHPLQCRGIPRQAINEDDRGWSTIIKVTV